MSKVLDFGDYCIIEQLNYGGLNEHYVHKVIGNMVSNTYVDVPVKLPRKETIHAGELVPCCACICCGVSETEVLKYRHSDVMEAEEFK